MSEEAPIKQMAGDWMRNIGFRTCGVLLAAGLAACGGQPGSAPGVFPFVDHDKLAFLPWGLALVFAAE
jgi:hypothetical protein